MPASRARGTASSRARRHRAGLAVATSCLVLGGGVLFGTAPATAHVHVDAPDIAQGGYGVLQVRVPNESDTSATTSVTVTLPKLKSAMTEPMAGWTSTVVKDPASAEATSVTWTAQPGTPGIPVGQFEIFRLSAGPMPTTASVSFPAVQTYADGQRVDWDQRANPDGSEPEHPAPEVTLAASSGDGHAAASPDRTTSSDSTAGSDDTARWLGGAGLVIGALGVALALGTTLRGRKR
ncbi:YcnI family copper-binding membrane protein [Williamsia sterculiae]|nr:YcnI family protein [Williamsia sterculiae]